MSKVSRGALYGFALAVILLSVHPPRADAGGAFYKGAGIATMLDAGCTKTDFITPRKRYPVIRCAPLVSGVNWLIPFALPEDSVFPVQVKLIAQSPDTTGNCDYFVQASCNPDGSDLSAATPQRWSNSEELTPSISVAGGGGRKSATTVTGLTPKNQVTNASCSGSQCSNVDCWLEVTYNPSLGSGPTTTCDFVGLYIIPN